MSRIIVHGCYHTLNFGDVLLLEVMADHLRRAYDVTPVCPWIHPSLEGKLLADPGAGLRACFAARAAIFGGGGYLDHFPERRKMRRLMRYSVPASIFRATKTPYVVTGPGVGLEIHGKGAARIKSICLGARAVCVRDQESKDSLIRVGIPGDRVEVTADLVLALTEDMIPDDAVRQAEELLGRATPGVRRLGMHVQSGGEERGRFDGYLRAIGPILGDRDDVEPIFFFDHGGPENEGFSRRIREHLPRARVLPAQSHWTLAAILKRFDAVITTKLHVGITAWTLGVPTCGFSVYHAKTSRFYRQIGREEFQAPISDDPARLVEWVRMFAEEPERFGAESPTAREELPRRARRNFEVIDEHLGEILRAAGGKA